MSDDAPETIERLLRIRSSLRMANLLMSQIETDTEKLEELGVAKVQASLLPDIENEIQKLVSKYQQLAQSEKNEDYILFGLDYDPPLEPEGG